MDIQVYCTILPNFYAWELSNLYQVYTILHIKIHFAPSCQFRDHKNQNLETYHINGTAYSLYNKISKSCIKIGVYLA